MPASHYSTSTALLSTLFPYTTLFRSIPQRYAMIEGMGYLFIEQHDSQPSPRIKVLRNMVVRLYRLALARASHVFLLNPDEDRKSTRLNSSHVAISYAVFCLKKKMLMK